MANLVGNSNIAAFTTPGSINANFGERFCGMQYVATASGTATSLFFYANDRGEGENVKLLIANSAGVVLASTAPISYTAGTGAAWKSASITPTAITSGQTYYIGAYCDSADGRIGAMSSGTDNWVDNESGTYAALPATLAALAEDGGNINMAFYADGTEGGGSSTTVTPTTGSAIAAGRQPSANSFTNVRIREVLINEAGSPVGNQTGIHLVVWYGGAPAGVPDLSYSNMTTDANGTTSWSIATGSLLYNQGVFYVAHDGHASMSVYTCARMVPTYS